ncbi:hypothetical protein JIP62_07210 [Brevundimonas vitis]|uniref:Uncharacterized protein n=1 Tax=Brevundimonas vitisensis TaxID=2800818 RepID=A0ABX7BRK4_9CAUL|nr:hypothetical protein [Brevundimonas vitisensis]QQQ19866.1 hypothetical protein JIP62_07210 [Brevundimonas vitisensis]
MSHQDPHSKVADAVHEGRPAEAQYVRQGRSGRRILLLLVVSAGAAAVLLLGIWLISNGGFQAQNTEDGGVAADARPFDDTDGVTPAPRADAPTTATGEPTSPPTGDAPNVNAPTVTADPAP